MTKKQKIKQNIKDLTRYGLTAVFGAAVNFYTQIPYKKLFLNIPSTHDNAFEWSIFAAYSTATIISFIPAKLYAFKSDEKGSTKREYIKWILIAAIAFVVQEVFSVLTLNKFAKYYFADKGLFFQEKFSHLIGMGFSFLTNFFGHRFLTFRTTGIYNKIKERKLKN